MEKYIGYVEHIIFQNKENGYTVFELTCEDDDYTCCGICQGLENGDHVELEGVETDHPMYGVQIKISAIKVLALEDAVSMERYLASGAIKGVGPSLASKIVKKFGDKTFDIIEQQPERLVEIKGISERIARQIWEQMEEKKGMREAFLYLQKLGISNNLALKIYNYYGAGMYSAIEENPYRLAEDIPGIGFKIADEIAGSLGINVDSDYRIKGGILYALQQIMSEGSLFCEKDRLVNIASEILSVDPDGVEPMLMNLAMEKRLIIKNENGLAAVYSTIGYYGEMACATMLNELQMFYKGMRGETITSEVLRKEIKSVTDTLDIDLDEIQLEAIEGSLNNGVFVLTGGPGTGKTTIINTILKIFETRGMDIMLAAPTGRAAKRMEEATGFEARTIHRLLEVGGLIETDKRSPRFQRNSSNPLECDVIIVDEMSMVDEFLFKSLLEAIAPGTVFIMVGDVNQLPSVGPGQVLRDVIESECFPVVKLEKIYRQSEDSHIIYNAHRINNGQSITLDNKSRDFFFLERNDVRVIYKHMVQLITEKMPAYVNCRPDEVQVLTPMRKGNLGVEILNEILQKYVNPPEFDKVERQFGDRILRVGDKVMQTKNNYQLEWKAERRNIVIDRGVGVFNGDIGVIKEINMNAEIVTVCFDDERLVDYPFSGCEELEHAYAVTIHKSQGSEYPAVVMPILSGPAMLMNRNLLYTGVTRARQCITILGSRDKVGEMIENKNDFRRCTGLKLRIIEVVRDY